MRSDLNKLICERERHRHEDHYHNYRHAKKFKHSRTEDYEDLPSREGMKTRFNHGGWNKDFNENLNPLWGYIRKNVGRPWDKVYSEICKTFDTRSVINNHILVHLFQFVKTDLRVSKQDGKIEFFDPSFASNGWKSLGSAWFEYYVDPTDGILKYNSHRTPYKQYLKKRLDEKRKEEAKVKRVISENIELHKINDVWYQVDFNVVKPEVRQYYDYTLKFFKTEKSFPVVYDVIKKSYVKSGRYAVSKTQLSKSGLKYHGLNK